MFDWNVVKQRVEALWSEFRIPMWVTEFDWNGDGEEVDFRDYTEYASILEDFYTADSLVFLGHCQLSLALTRDTAISCEAAGDILACSAGG